MIGMRLRRVPASQIVLPLIKANKAGMNVNVNQLEAHYLAGGNVDRVIDALIAAHRAQIPLTFERSCAIDLAGRNVLEAVQMSVNPEVIETPVVSAVAKNGIELKVKARVTVRANIDRLVGGAGEATIIARVGEGLAMAVAKEQEMKAYTQEMQAKVVEAEAKVPAALAEALEKGRLGVMDYYRMNNIIADTDMRKMIAGNEQDVEVDKNPVQK